MPTEHKAFKGTDALNYVKELSRRIIQEPSLENLNKFMEMVDVMSSEAVNYLHSFLLYPLTYNIANRNRYGNKEDITRKLLESLHHILLKLELQSIDSVSYLSRLLVAVISSDQDRTKVSQDISEELKLNTIRCIAAVFSHINESCMSELYNCSNAANRRTIAIVVYLCLQIARNEQLLSLRLEAMECVLILGRMDDKNLHRMSYDKTLKNKMRDVVTPILPGIVSACVHIVTSGSVLNHKIYVKTIQLFGRSVSLVMEDEKTENDSDIYEYCKEFRLRKLTEEQTSVVRSVEWFNETNEKLKMFISSIASLRSHSHWKVRSELLISMKLLLSKCFKNLSSNTKYAAESVIGLLEDDMPQIRAQSQQIIDDLLNDNLARKDLMELLEDSFYDHLLHVEFTINTVDENVLLSELNFLNGYLKFVDLRTVLKCGSYLENLVKCLIRVFQFDLTSLQYIQHCVVELNENAESESEFEKSWLKLKYLTSEKLLKAALNVCETIGRRANLLEISDHLLELLRFDTSQRKEVLLLINNICLSQSTIGFETFKNILQIYLEEGYFSIPVSVEENTSNHLPTSVIRNNTVQVCLVVDGIGKMFSSAGNTLSPLLLHSLYPILENAGSSNEHVSSAGLKTLRSISHSCGYSDVTQMIAENMDYVTYHVTKKLRTIRYDQTVFDAFSVVIKECSEDALHVLCDIMEEILHKDTDILHDSCRLGYLKVFKLFVRKLRTWFVPIIEDEKVDINRSRGTYKNILIETDEYLQKYRISHYTSTISANSKCVTELQDIHINELFQADKLNMNDIPDVTDDENISEKRESDTEAAMKEMGEEKPSLPTYVELTVSLCNKLIHVLPVKHVLTKIMVTEILMDCILVLSKWEDQLLPVVHQIWSPLVKCVSKESLDVLVLRRSFELICLLAVTSRDFIKSRTLKEVLPSLLKFLQQTSLDSALKIKSSTYHMSQQYKLQHALLSELGHLSVYIGLQEEELNQILDRTHVYLSNKQPAALQEAATELYKEISSLYPCLVWMNLVSVWSPTRTLRACNDLKKFGFGDIAVDTCTDEKSEYRECVTRLMSIFYI